MLILNMPAFGNSFNLMDVEKNLPGSAVTSSQPSTTTYQQVCHLLSRGNWTLERDEDLTAPYAFLGPKWLAFDDDTSLKIKAKYVLLRDMAGVGLMSIDADDLDNVCGKGKQSLLNTIGAVITNLQRKPRQLIVTSLEQDLLATAQNFVPVTSAQGLHVSPFRIVRIVDREGRIQSIRENSETVLECSRQGYYRHPEDCSRFYRCVKFNQYENDYTIFEYGCPDGLVFDDRWEVCVWPSQATPCDGSSEIFPIPRNEYVCPGEGFFVDPENCRWFYACRDHHGDGTFTHYEFRCPFGLAFDEANLRCDWPWNVPGCDNEGGNHLVSPQLPTRKEIAQNFNPGGNVSPFPSVPTIPSFESSRTAVPNFGRQPNPTFPNLEQQRPRVGKVVKDSCENCQSPVLTITGHGVSNGKGLEVAAQPGRGGKGLDLDAPTNFGFANGAGGFGGNAAGGFGGNGAGGFGGNGAGGFGGNGGGNLRGNNAGGLSGNSDAGSFGGNGAGDLFGEGVRGFSGNRGNSFSGNGANGFGGNGANGFGGNGANGFGGNRGNGFGGGNQGNNFGGNQGNNFGGNQGNSFGGNRANGFGGNKGNGFGENGANPSGNFGGNPAGGFDGNRPGRFGGNRAERPGQGGFGGNQGAGSGRGGKQLGNGLGSGSGFSNSYKSPAAVAQYSTTVALAYSPYTTQRPVTTATFATTAPAYVEPLSAYGGNNGLPAEDNGYNYPAPQAPLTYPSSTPRPVVVTTPQPVFPSTTPAYVSTSAAPGAAYGAPTVGISVYNPGENGLLPNGKPIPGPSTPGVPQYGISSTYSPTSPPASVSTTYGAPPVSSTYAPPLNPTYQTLVSTPAPLSEGYGVPAAPVVALNPLPTYDTPLPPPEESYGFALSQPGYDEGPSPLVSVTGSPAGVQAISSTYGPPPYEEPANTYGVPAPPVVSYQPVEGPSETYGVPLAPVVSTTYAPPPSVSTTLTPVVSSTYAPAVVSSTYAPPVVSSTYGPIVPEVGLPNYGEPANYYDAGRPATLPDSWPSYDLPVPHRELPTPPEITYGGFKPPTIPEPIRQSPVYQQPSYSAPRPNIDYGGFRGIAPEPPAFSPNIPAYGAPPSSGYSYPVPSNPLVSPPRQPAPPPVLVSSTPSPYNPTTPNLPAYGSNPVAGLPAYHPSTPAPFVDFGSENKNAAEASLDGYSYPVPSNPLELPRRGKSKNGPNNKAVVNSVIPSGFTSATLSNGPFSSISSASDNIRDEQRHQKALAGFGRDNANGRAPASFGGNKPSRGPGGFSSGGASFGTTLKPFVNFGSDARPGSDSQGSPSASNGNSAGRPGAFGGSRPGGASGGSGFGADGPRGQQQQPGKSTRGPADSGRGGRLLEDNGLRTNGIEGSSQFTNNGDFRSPGQRPGGFGSNGSGRRPNGGNSGNRGVNSGGSSRRPGSGGFNGNVGSGTLPGAGTAGGRPANFGVGSTRRPNSGSGTTRRPGSPSTRRPASPSTRRPASPSTRRPASPST